MNMTRSKYLLLFAFLFILLVKVSFVSATFSKSDITTWATDPDSIKQFEVLSDADKNAAWITASPSQKSNFVKKYSESKQKKVEFVGFSSKDLIWQGNKLIVINDKKKAGFDFNSRDSLKKVTYDIPTKTMLYEFEKGDIKNSVRLDDGYVDEKGFLVKDTNIRGSLAPKPVADVKYGNGLLKYTNGEFSIDNSERQVKIGNNYYSRALDEGLGIITLDSNNLVSVYNSQVLLMESIDSTTASAVFKTGIGENGDGSPKFVTLFDSKEVPKDFSNPYFSYNLKEKTAVLDDYSSNPTVSTYMQLELFSDFKSISGSGTQAWVKNGEAVFDFSSGKILFAEGSGKGSFEIDRVNNILSDPSEKNTFTFKKFRDNPYTDFFNRDTTLVNSGALLSESSGVKVVGPRGRVLAGEVKTGYSSLDYSQAYSPDYFHGTEEERLAAIVADPNTVVRVNAASGINIPGQYFASEALSMLDYQLAVASLQAKDNQVTLDSQLSSIGTLVGNKDLSDSSVRASVVDSMINGVNVFGRSITEGTAAMFRKQNPGISDEQIRAKTELLLDAYILNKNYVSNTPMTGLSQEQINALPSVNRLLYEAANNYRGSISIPDTVREARSTGGATSTGGASEIELKSDGVYLNGNKIEGVNPTVSSALKDVFSSSLLNFETGVSERQAQVLKYGDRIKVEGYPFDINDYRIVRYQNNVYVTGLIGAKQAVTCSLNSGKCELASKDAKYQYYYSNGRLP